MKSVDEAAIAKKSPFWGYALERVVRFAVAVPLLLCALAGFTVAAPVWLGSRLLKVLGFEQNY